MKLQTVLENLTGIKKYNNSWWSEFVNDLSTKYGFEENRMGMFSRVLTRPDLNYVYKIFDNDSAYMSFINIHSGNFMEREDGTIVIIDPIMVRGNDTHVTMFDQPSPKKNKPFTLVGKDNRAVIKF